MSDISEYWYVGSKNDFNFFERTEGAETSHFSGMDFIFSSESEAGVSGPIIKKVALDLKKPKRISRQDLASMSKSYPIDELQKKFISRGYDGLIIEASQGDSVLEIEYRPEQRVVFSSNQIKLIETINNLDVKEILKQRYGSEKNLGLTYENESNQTFSYDEMMLIDPEEDESITAILPNDFGEFAICTNSARFVVDNFGRGDVYGFFVEDNPVADKEISDAGGHDFAVIDGRYIVDLWISLYSGSMEQVVYDLQDPKDESAIANVFGKPINWCYRHPDTGTFIRPSSQDYPIDKRISLAATVDAKVKLHP